MEHDFFAEEGEYTIFCSAEPQSKGKWIASALFERKVDRSKVFVPAVRHRIVDASFDTPQEAAQAAYQHALQLIKKGTVGLE
jgi:hypothetical protein